jgi:hypothetical protein
MDLLPVEREDDPQRLPRPAQLLILRGAGEEVEHIRGHDGEHDAGLAR